MGPVVHEPQHNTAKTEHRCTWCGEQILRRQRYWRWTAIFEGQYADTNKMHDECKVACDADSELHGHDEGYVPFDNRRGGPPNGG
jgi:hypothetical protein